MNLQLLGSNHTTFYGKICNCTSWVNLSTYSGKNATYLLKYYSSVISVGKHLIYTINMNSIYMNSFTKTHTMYMSTYTGIYKSIT